MDDHFSQKGTPEEKELERKRAELEKMEIELTQRELDLTSLRIELRNFEEDYHKLVGSRFAELDRIEAQINEYTEYLRVSKRFKPSDNLKSLYREVAKQIHPDLAANEHERLRRQELMAEVNNAYEQEDEGRLRSILQKWLNSPDVVDGEGIAPELIRTLRKMAQISERVKAIEQEIELLKKTELYQLKDRVDQANEKGNNLLKMMSDSIEQQILKAQQKLEAIKLKMEF
ncbi:molecular chaperone DnaJ [Nodosilinea sp. AN01ver1]|uniref:molecular chaperone DnaJ n=1 Tax=Nodosilinea sp. AN01ver1 TaxID=3423362 RepID=UPI003D31EB09